MMSMNLNMRSMIKRRREQEEDMDILMNLMLPLIPFRLVKVIPRLQALTEFFGSYCTITNGKIPLVIGQ